MNNLYLQSAILLLVSLINGVSLYVRPMQQHIPYVNSMILHFGLANSHNDTGFYSGILDSLAMFGRILSSPIWGIISDRLGRKFVLLSSLLAVAVNNLCFGLCSTFTAAFTCRLLLGITSGIPVAGKAIANEIEGGKYQTRLMALYSLGHSLGIVIGVAAGGTLAGVRVWGFMESYPYFTPNFCCCILCLTAFIIVWTCFTETLSEASKHKANNSFTAFLDILRAADIRVIFFILCLTSFGHSFMEELVTLWCWADEAHGGLELNSRELGYLISISVMIMELVQQWLYVVLVNCTGHVRLVQWDCYLCVPAALLMPCTYYLGGARLAMVLAVLVFWNLVMYHIYASLFILANNYVHKHERGKINGIALSFSSSFKALAPITAGVSFAWSLQVNSFFINYQFSFYLLAVICGGAAWFSSRLGRHLEVSRAPLKTNLL
jgi:MFS family permease